MNKKIKVYLTVVIVGILFTGVYFWSILRTEAGAINKVATDLIGTRVGSSTTPVNFYVFGAASTTYPFWVGSSKSATISIGVTEASSTAIVNVSLLGSNDYGCNTATTTTILNILTKSEVKWFDASPSLRGATAPTSITKATTTLVWTDPEADTMKEIVLTDLAVECLAIQLNASSTKVWAQYRLKD